MDSFTSEAAGSPPPTVVMAHDDDYNRMNPPPDPHRSSANTFDSLSWQQRLPPPPPPHLPPPILDQDLAQRPGIHHNASYQDHQPAEPAMGSFMTTPYFPNGFFDMASATGTWTPMGAVGPTSMGASMDLDEIDLHFLNSYNTNLPFEIASDSGTNHTPQTILDRTLGNSVDQGGPDSSSRIASSNAFRNAYWKFQPGAGDHGGAEEHNLSLPAGEDGQPSSTAASRITRSQRLKTTPLSLNARDKILTLIVDNCRPENLSRAVASFPSIELLDALIHFYLSSPIVRSSSFLHIPSFNPNEKKAELLAAMAAAGAVLTSDPALIKLGSAIQECARHAVPKHWERDNSTTRDLELSQAWMISLETAIWSGHSRKVEIAESFMQPLLTMLRRNARFRPSGYTEVKLWPDDENQILENRWKEWVTQESFKRLAFRMFQHDTDASLALMINPLVSYAEVVVELPCSDELWAAPNKDRWKALYLTTQQQQQTSPAAFSSASPYTHSITLSDYLDNPTFHLPTDILTASSAYLGVVWRLAWEFMQLASMQKRARQPQRWNSHLLSSRHEELVKLLGRFRLSLDDVPPTVSNSICMVTMMRAEHIAVHIHVPFEDIMRFAGMEGAEQSRIAYVTVVEWVRTEAARKAVWHAGQILRCARTAHKLKVQGPMAVIVFHASLILWVYGLVYAETVGDGGGEAARRAAASINNNGNSDASIHGTQGLQQQHQHQHQHQHNHVPQQGEDLRLRPLVSVDDDESGAVQRFIQFDRGAPSIQKRVASSDSGMSNDGVASTPHPKNIGARQAQHVSLFEPDRVMDAIIDILSQNHPPKSRPPLVENLVQVLTELARSSPSWAARPEYSKS
ncbi:DNA binding [Microdochium nivale]|nr:DNA binding [Microdochium nivale]